MNDDVLHRLTNHKVAVRPDHRDRRDDDQVTRELEEQGLRQFTDAWPDLRTTVRGALEEARWNGRPPVARSVGSRAHLPVARTSRTTDRWAVRTATSHRPHA